MRHKRLLIHLTVLGINWQINNLHARIEDLIRDPEKVEIASEMYEDIIKEDWRIARKIKRPNSPIQLPEDLQDASQELAVRVLSPDSGNILRLLNPQEAEVVFQFFDLLRMLDDLGDGIINHVNGLLPQDRQMPRGCFLELYHQFADAESSIPKHSPMSTHPWERMRKLMEIYRQAREASYHHISCGPERNNDPYNDLRGFMGSTTARIWSMQFETHRDGTMVVQERGAPA
ncbi:MAG: hypothetical protein Q9200_001102 [Gallowayella weberi]